MARTTPTSVDQEPVGAIPSRGQRTSRVTRYCYRLEKICSEVQVGRQGSYSIERAESMDYYCKNSSLTRVIAVCVLTPLPTLTCAIMLESLPLQPPSERWTANWVFWIRLGLMVFLLTFAGVSELKIFIPELHFTWCKRVIIAFGTTAAYLGVYIPLMVLLVFGRKQLDRSSRCYPSLCRFLRFFFAYIVLIELYPLYKVLRDLAPLTYRGVVVAVLPVWRLAAETFIVQSTRQLEDLIPTMVTFSVDLFSMLSCPNADTVLELLREQRDLNRGLGQGIPGQSDCSGVDELLTKLLVVARNPGSFRASDTEGTRLWARLPHPTSAEQTEQLKRLDFSGFYSRESLPVSGRTSKATWRLTCCQRLKSRLARGTPVVPGPGLALINVTTQAGIASPESINPDPKNLKLGISASRSSAFVRQGLRLLFHSEYLALVEYVECVVPLIFMIYKSVLAQLPNAIYFPAGAQDWNVAAVTNLLVFSALEVISLALMDQYLQHKFKFRPLYQLAYVLETQFYLVQAKLLIATVLTLRSASIGSTTSMARKLQEATVQYTYIYERDSCTNQFERTAETLVLILLYRKMTLPLRKGLSPMNYRPSLVAISRSLWRHVIGCAILSPQSRSVDLVGCQITMAINRVEASKGTEVRTSATPSRPSAAVSPTRLVSLWDRLEKKWNALQVGRQGSYSVERLESLDHYCKTASRARVIAVCLLTPIPALVVALLLESLPLRPPSEGWAANWMFWIRLALMELAMGFAGSTQQIAFVPGLQISVFKRFMVALGSSAGYLGACLVAAATIGFPVPLQMQLGAIPIGISMAVMTRLVLGPAPFAKDSPHLQHFERLNRVISAHMLLIGVYPIYKVLYDHVPLTYRGVVVIVLPLWRLAAKRFIVWKTRELEDLVPELVAFTVDFFSSLFVAVCMSTSGSIYLSALFIAADFGQTMLEFREVRENANIVLELLRDRAASRYFVAAVGSSDDIPSLLPMILAITRNPVAFKIRSLEGVRLRACLPHTITSQQAAHLRELDGSSVYTQRAPQILSQPHRNKRRGLLSNRNILVVPSPTGHSLSTITVDSKSKTDN